MTLQTVIREKTCQVCGDPFLPFRSMQTVCGTKCALKVGPITRRKAKLARKMDRARLNEMRPLSYWVKQAQTAFNAWIRARDVDVPCISCDDALAAKSTGHRGSLYHAGHYLTTGARPELRFDEDNVHKQCAQCNLHLHGNPVAFRIGLVRRKGQAVVDRLEGPHPPRQLRRPDLIAIRDDYRARLKALR
jgi:hypothetical protein